MGPDDDPQIDPAEPIIAPALAAVDPPVAVDPPEPAPAVDPAKPLPPKWAIDEITRERTARRTETAARESAEAKLRDAEAMLERLQKGEKTPAVASARAADPSPDRYNADVAAAASRQRMYEDAEQVVSVGQRTFKNFNESLNVLTALGVTNDDFVGDLIAVDKANAHVMVDKLAKDPERAVQISKMSPKARISELTRMAMSEEQPKVAAVAERVPKVAAVSKAPAPKPALDPAGANPADWMSDEADDETFFQGFKRKYKIA